MSRWQGMTLTEAAVALAICATLAAWGLPALSGLLLDQRLTAASNDLLHALRGAWVRAQAATGDVVVCRSTDGRQCGGAGDWADGWIVFANRNRDDPPRVSPGEAVVAVQRAVPGLHIRSNRTAYVLRPAPWRATNGTLTVCDRRGPSSARAVIINVLGRVRVARQSASGTPLACAP